MHCKSGIYFLLFGCLCLFGTDLQGSPPPSPSVSEIITNQPRAIAASLCIPQYEDDKISNWNAALTCAELSRLAYEDDDEATGEIRSMGFERIQFLSNWNSQAVVCSTDEVVVIAFRGTESIRDIITDFDILSAYYDWGYIHLGFYIATSRIYYDVLDSAIQHGAASKKVCVTGHSLGGAMAAIFSLWAMKSKHLEIFSLTTFGQPLPMSVNHAMFMNEKLKGQYRRFVHGSDPITHVLPVHYWHSGGRIHMHETLDITPPGISFYRASDSNPSDPEAMTLEEFRELQMAIRVSRGDFDFSCSDPKRKLRKRHLKRCCSCPAKFCNPEMKIHSMLLFEDHSMVGYIEKIHKFGYDSSK